MNPERPRHQAARRWAPLLSGVLGVFGGAAMAIAVVFYVQPTTTPLVSGSTSTTDPGAAARVCASEGELRLRDFRVRRAFAKWRSVSTVFNEVYGEPIPEPEDLPPQFEPEALEGALADLGDGAQTALNCDHYPCVAEIMVPEDEDGWPRLPDAWRSELGYPNAVVFVGSVTVDGVRHRRAEVAFLAEPAAESQSRWAATLLSNFVNRQNFRSTLQAERSDE